MSFSNDELNYLIFCYLHESGFEHSAYMFSVESKISESKHLSQSLPSSALLSIVQKGLLYQQIEINVERRSLAKDKYIGQFRSPAHVSVLDTSKLALIDSIIDLHNLRNKCNKDDIDISTLPVSLDLMNQYVNDNMDVVVSDDDDIDDDDETKQDIDTTCIYENVDKESHDKSPNSVMATNIDSNSTISVQIQRHVTLLRGHEQEVFICSWNPNKDLLASGSGDSTARIWNLIEMHEPTQLILRHGSLRETNQINKDVTSLHWNSTGNYLATGSYDGHARIWSSAGQLIHVLSKHKGPVFSVKWNKSGTCLLTAGVDASAIVWSSDCGEMQQQFFCHSAPVLDADWRNDREFATCSTDSQIYICRLGDSVPYRMLSGHQGEVNAICWSPDGRFLASCSDDSTLKIWQPYSSGSCSQLLYNFDCSGNEIYTIQWSSTGESTNYLESPLLLASGSFDSTVRIFEICDQSCQCVHTLKNHTGAVYSIAFSPDGKMLATGSFDKSVNIWDVHNGKLIDSQHATNGIFDISWNSVGDKIAACTSDGIISVFELTTTNL
ncbi:hypothetical protein GJ496_004304 [Pomphorhynchus laevis]|nr:hypothetical protein GJ496_004304 [Pomphorhynchus laevis]